MQLFEVVFSPGQLNPVRITDAIPAEMRPFPHVPVGRDPEKKGERVPLTGKLAATGSPERVIARAGVFRDPKTGRIVLGMEQSNGDDPRALVLLSASNSFPEGVVISPGKGVSVLARGDIRNGEQLLVIWPDAGTVVIQDPVREERHEFRRVGTQFERTMLGEAAESSD
jgi:hypothetical protein